MSDNVNFNLQRFVEAQSSAWPRAIEELSAGRKQSHWMWFIFPQLAGLGMSPTAQLYALASEEEARAYLRHPLLGPRLIEATEATEAVLAHQGKSLYEIFGSPDDMKFRSSMTLFELASGDAAAPFTRALDAFCAGQRDDKTLALLDWTPAADA
ncbi:uncharacterized protein (DUF1810 family) [Rhizobium sp. SG_E_25_P2]|uniref:DUF1810 domain-containing protein n=1 Tax=Rhizobium sp. SG_E_25_P2 TaxID=2879942 RepID=UPI0024733157|nr:DUF1810 domain-containing protein [Rhizobium sp. SG_E_25_P2]MDH6265463.1 uncharacterized protein (DUF1810 family) [Rhizobium sp. SG_E_25_P2]